MFFTISSSFSVLHKLKLFGMLTEQDGFIWIWEGGKKNDKKDLYKLSWQQLQQKKIKKIQL